MIPATVALRTTLIWHGEVMEDLVSDQPVPITLGATGQTTFTIPELGLPQGFAIVRPGNRGYLLTLGDKMRGTICIDGEQKDVSEFVQRGGEGEGPGGFRATPISGRDWGVVDLDDTGEFQLFFQFVPLEERNRPILTRTFFIAGVIGWLLSALFLGVGLWLTGANPWFPGALQSGFLIATSLLVTVGVLGFALGWFVLSALESQLSYVFSVIAHGALIAFAFIIGYNSNPFAWPGPRVLTGNYLVTRINTPPPEPPKPPPKAGASMTEAAPKADNPKPKATATQGEAGASGGKGEERATTTHPVDDKPAPPRVALFEDRNRKVLDNIIDHSFATDLSKFNGIKGDETKRGSLGAGHATSGSGVGDECRPGTACSGTRGDSKGKGPGGGGNAKGDFVSNGKPLDTGGERAGGTCVGPNCKGTGPKEIKVALADPSGDFGGLTADEIDRVVKARAGVFRACYQKELNHSPGIGGKLVVHFVIGGDGSVKSANNAGGTLTNDEVSSCVKSNIMRLKFPAKGGVANVNYPFVFSQGG